MKQVRASTASEASLQAVLGGGETAQVPLGTAIVLSSCFRRSDLPGVPQGGSCMALHTVLTRYSSTSVSHCRESKLCLRKEVYCTMLGKHISSLFLANLSLLQ